MIPLSRRIPGFACRRLHFPCQRSQQGSALLVSLVMLLLLSLIAVAGMQSTIMQDRMSSNLRDRDLAFQAAESALREAEELLRNHPPKAFTNEDGLYKVNNDNHPQWRTDTDDDGSGYQAVDVGPEGVARQPQYYIEEIDTFRPAGSETETGVAVPPVVFFRVTALGYGGSEDTTVVLSSVYRNQ